MNRSIINLNNLRLIEIELFGYCNRKCVWCPNNFIDRKKTYNYLDIKYLISLLKELQQINYSNYISFSRYNEPMSQIDFFKSRLQLIKDILPNAILVSNTNGDYLTENNLKGLLINELTIMDYDNKGLQQCISKLQNINCTIDEIKEPYIYAHYNNIKILYFTNWQKYCIINNRGGNLPQYNATIRDYSCFEPQYFIGINYDGTISPCCQIRNDCENQKPYIIGDLKQQSLKEILNSEKRLQFISNCKNKIFEKDSPCYYCLNNGGRYTRKKGGIYYE